MNSMASIAQTAVFSLKPEDLYITYKEIRLLTNTSLKHRGPVTERLSA